MFKIWGGNNFHQDISISSVILVFIHKKTTLKNYLKYRLGYCLVSTLQWKLSLTLLKFYLHTKH